MWAVVELAPVVEPAQAVEPILVLVPAPLLKWAGAGAGIANHTPIILRSRHQAGIVNSSSRHANHTATEPIAYSDSVGTR